MILVLLQWLQNCFWFWLSLLSTALPTSLPRSCISGCERSDHQFGELYIFWSCRPHVPYSDLPYAIIKVSISTSTAVPYYFIGTHDLSVIARSLTVQLFVTSLSYQSLMTFSCCTAPKTMTPKKGSMESICFHNKSHPLGALTIDRIRCNIRVNCKVVMRQTII